jgi:hypothetical protein
LKPIVFCDRLDNQGFKLLLGVDEGERKHELDHFGRIFVSNILQNSRISDYAWSIYEDFDQTES